MAFLAPLTTALEAQVIDQNAIPLAMQEGLSITRVFLQESTANMGQYYNVLSPGIRLVNTVIPEGTNSSMDDLLVREPGESMDTFEMRKVLTHKIMNEMGYPVNPNTAVSLAYAFVYKSFQSGIYFAEYETILQNVLETLAAKIGSSSFL